MYLEKIKTCDDIKKLNINELSILCDEIRKVIITAVSNNGGHLSSNLGTVELTVALFYVFDFPKDKIIFDVGHQCYAYKILSERFNKIDSIRKEGGISGFPDINESVYDSFCVGHAGTSISAGLGYAFSRDKLNKDYNVINVVGDASIFNGENLEALTSYGYKPNKFLVILNDNGMSISKNNNGLYKLISKITVTKNYNKFNGFLDKVFGKWFLGKFLKKIKRAIKRSLSSKTFTDAIGLKYVGLFDGHNLKTLIKLLTDIKESENPTLLHVKTIKGKGYEEAEKDSSLYHGVSKNLESSHNYFSENISDILERLYQKNDKIVAITAGMKDGVGLSKFSKNHQNSVIDTGISEEYAVTLSAGIGISGLKPIVFIYSTFMQRAYDQILHDVCLQNLPVIFCLDRAGLVGSDGKTHQGVFDISYLSHIPNLKIFAPKDAKELEDIMTLALDINGPVAIRYPNGNKYEIKSTSVIDSNLSWEVLNDGENNVILAVGPRMIDLAYKLQNNFSKPITIINARVIKPLDFNILNKYSSKNIITLEENAEIGGFGSSILKYYTDNNMKANVKVFGVKDNFVQHASVESQLISNGLTVDNILKYLV